MWDGTRGCGTRGCGGPTIFPQNMGIHFTLPSALKLRNSGYLALIHYCQLSYRLHSDFTTCYNNVLYSNVLPPRILPQGRHCIWLPCLPVSFNLEPLSRLSLPFMTLTFWESTSQLFYRLFLNLGLIVFEPHPKNSV